MKITDTTSIFSSTIASPTTSKSEGL